MGPSANIEAVGVLTSLLYAEGLVMHDWSGQTKPLLAESWRWSDDRKTLSLELKKDVVFHDGSQVTADTVVRSLRAKVEEKRLGFAYVTAMNATGPLSIDIHLSRPDAFLLPELSDLRLTHPDDEDIGTGPFQIVKRDPIQIQTTRFDRYHDGASALSGVNIAVFNSQRSAWAALMKGDVDVVQEVSRESVEFMKGSTRVRAFSAVQPFYVPIFLNQSHPALRNREVRLAMLEALDRQAIIEQAMTGFGQIADGPIWPQHWAYQAPERRHPDPAAARARLERAGFKLKARAGGPKSRFSFRCLVLNEDPQLERIALMVARQLFDVGIDMSIEMVSLQALLPRAAKGDFDGLLGRVNSSRTLNITYQFWRSADGVLPAIINTGYHGTDDAFDRFRLAGTNDETRAAVHALVERFSQDVPALFIAWVEVTRAVDTRFVAGDTQASDPFLNLRQWRLAAPAN